jgi:ribonuclease Z
MARVTLLGSAYSVPDASHENTHFVAVCGQHTILVDCAGDPIARLRQAGVDPLSVSDIILTHFHPDHVYGVPILLMDMWLLGRRDPVRVHGLADTLSRTQAMMELYDWHSWPNFYEVTFHPMAEAGTGELFAYPEVCVSARPVCHLIPTIGLRFDFLETGKSLAYSSDTEPCEQVVQLARGVDLLLHESSGASHGHSSPTQAAQIANRAGAQSLCLIHYPTRAPDPQKWLQEAFEYYSGPITLAEDFMVLDF